MKTQISKQQLKKKMLQANSGCLPPDIERFYRNPNRFEGSFRMAIWPILAIGQFYGVMPVVGVSRWSLSELKFKWKCFRTFYAIIVAIISTVHTAYFAWNMIRDTDSGQIAGMFFYCTSYIAFINFLVLSLHWPDLMRKWQAIESLPAFRNFVHKTAYIRRLRLVLSSVLLLALVEHCIFISVTFEENPYFNPRKNPFPNIAIAFTFMSENATFVWNFIDVFIMAISIGLTTHFKVLNCELGNMNFETEDESNEFSMKMQKMRVQYTRMSELVDTVDEKISIFVLLSFINNFFMICRQLYESLKPSETYFYMFYFWFSLIFLILRTFVVSFLAARINDESRKPINILRTIPSYLWDEETKRFLDDVLCQHVALSGSGLFFITRQLILSVIGTIITYELVLMQFTRL